MNAAAPTHVWHALRHDTFRALWTAALISMIGAWMQGLGASWLMTELDRSPIMVGLVQAAQMIPAICLAPVAGALADMFDRRRFLMGVMAWQGAFTLLLAILTFSGLITPWLLIACIFAAGAGNAYVLSDRGTWIHYKNKDQLAVLVEGDKRMFNQYGVMLVNPEKHPTVKKDLGQAFIDYLISPEGQKAIANYKINGEQLFYPNAEDRGA